MSSINPTSSSLTSSQSKKRNHHGSSANSSDDDDLPWKIQKLPMMKKKILSENVVGKPAGEVDPAKKEDLANPHPKRIPSNTAQVEPMEKKAVVKPDIKILQPGEIPAGTQPDFVASEEERSDDELKIRDSDYFDDEENLPATYYRNDDKHAKGPKEEYVPEDDDEEKYRSGSGFGSDWMRVWRLKWKQHTKYIYI